MTIHIDIEYVTRIEEENKKLKNEIKEASSDVGIFIEENEQLQEENKELKKEIENFYYQQSKIKENDFYINALKNQLFNAYLEIESHNVNIQISHYHIKKLLETIDEYTLINPYTD